MRHVIDTDGRLAKLNGGQPYVVENQRGEPSATGKLIAIDAVWASPVDTAGPWLKLVCQNTAQYQTNGHWSKLRTVSVTVDLGTGTVMQFVPSGVVANDLGGVLDTRSDPGKAPQCAQGENDD